MQLRADIQIQSVLKAMTDVILPALDPQNQLAQEQVRLCMGLLSVLRQQLPLQFKFDLDELKRQIALTERLLELAGGHEFGDHSVSKLQGEHAKAVDVLQRAKAGPDEVLAAVRALRSVTGELLQAEDLQKSPLCPAVDHAVLESSRAQLLRDRSWVLAQNWEANPAAIPPIDTLLGA